MIRRHRREGGREKGERNGEGSREERGGVGGGNRVYPLVTSDVMYSFAELILMLIVMFC